MSRAPSPDFSRQVVADLYRYGPKRRGVAWALWLATGLLGGHRLYLDRTASGLAMLATGGGAGFWWLADVFFLDRMVRSYNDRQAERESAGLPPLGMEFLPPLPGDDELEGEPAWASRRRGRPRLLGDALVLLVAGSALGGVTAQRGDFEALVAVAVLIAVTIFGARWDSSLPLLADLDRWSHRLRLYYRFHDPGGPLALLFRPLVGPLTAWFRRQARMEVRLYLQLGAVFTIGFTALDVARALVASGGLDADALVGDVFSTFFTVYAFATPIGATLTTHLLLERRDEIVWALSALTVVAIGAGFLPG